MGEIAIARLSEAGIDTSHIARKPGAGDSFNADFLRAWLNGDPPSAPRPSPTSPELSPPSAPEAPRPTAMPLRTAFLQQHLANDPASRFDPGPKTVRSPYGGCTLSTVGSSTPQRRAHLEFALGYVLILLVLSSGPNRSTTFSRAASAAASHAKPTWTKGSSRDLFRITENFGLVVPATAPPCTPRSFGMRIHCFLEWTTSMPRQD
jgi:hypothetical protein